MENRLTNCLHCSAPITGRGGYKKLCDTCKLTWKWCPRCESLKVRAEFAPNGRTLGYCQECHSAYGRQQRSTRESKDWYYRRHLKRKFGVSDEEAARLATVAECEICAMPPIPGDRLHVDHDHVTGEVRGVLCRWCNYAVAVLEDHRLTQVKTYLRTRQARLRVVK